MSLNTIGGTVLLEGIFPGENERGGVLDADVRRPRVESDKTAKSSSRLCRLRKRIDMTEKRIPVTPSIEGCSSKVMLPHICLCLPVSTPHSGCNE